jgi:hypothetical protein
MTRAIVGWKLNRDERERLLRDHCPRYADVVADHVTFRTGSAALPANVRASIVGHVDDGEGVEAMVVSVDGTTDRPDGSTYHITWSLGPGHDAKESNDVLKKCDWREFDQPIPVTLTPSRL